MNSIKNFFSSIPILALFLVGGILISSCGGKNEPDPVVPDGMYSGTLKVTYNGEIYTTEGVEVEATSDAGLSSVTLVMYAVKFVPQMPVTIDITIPSVPMSKEGILSGDGIVPIAMGGPVERYTVSNLNGKVEEGKIGFDLLFGQYPTSFSGTLKGK